jgi:hypothetical protein
VASCVLDNPRYHKALGDTTTIYRNLYCWVERSGDNYMIALNDRPAPGKAILLLAAGLAVDVIYKEK